MDFGETQDATYDPDESITVLTESADVTLLELFEVCPVCRLGTDVIYKKGECTAKPVKADATFPESHRLYLKAKQCTNNYVDNLLDLIFHEVFQDPAPYVNEVLKISIPEDLSAKYEKPDKQEVIASYVSIREHSAYLEHQSGGQDHPDSPAQIAPTPANKASVHQIPVTAEQSLYCI